MAPNPSLPPESHYDPKKLGKIFAIVSVVLLLSLVGLFIKDYSRQWKEYQRQFRSLEVEKARIKLDEQQNALSKNDEYQKVSKELKDAQAKSSTISSQKKALEQKIKVREAQLAIHTKDIQFAKAKYDALKYRYDAASHNSSPDAQSLKSQLDALSTQIEKFQILVEADSTDIKSNENALKDLQKEVKALEKKSAQFTKKADIIQRKLKKIDIDEMGRDENYVRGVANQLGDIVRDLPIIDLANPNFKVNQIVLKDIPEDVNFMKVQRVDRCTTCHLGIDNPDFKKAAQPFTTHPQLELFMDKNSAHPLEAFGCTSCHGGRGRATDFVSAAHTPRDEEQKKEWEKKYGWHELHHWDQPMLAGPVTQAGCFKCHENQTVIKGAEKLNLGMNLIERAGCYNCHTIQKYEDWPKSGPNLNFIASKSTKEWAYRWIDNPKSIRPNTWMPSYFHQSNNSDPVSTKRGEQEVHAMVEYLFANSKEFKVDSVLDAGDVKNGKELVASIGCLACHQVDPKKTDKGHTPESVHREFGPNLIGLGSKTTKEWLYQWLKDPSQYHAATRMPNMRLTDKEASDITAFLIEDKSPVLDKPAPAVNDQILNNIVFDFLKKSSTISESEAKIKAMSQSEKLVFAGQKLIREYGCYSCHQITGFENDKPIGVDLTEVGTKDTHRLDFGFVHIEHSKKAWFKQKLMDPRIFDKGKTVTPVDKLRMPNFNFTHEQSEAITTALMGFVKERPSPNMLAGQGIKGAFIDDGAKTIRQLNCQSCHIIDGEGGAINSTVTDWLVNSQSKDLNDAKTLTSSFSPPNLLGEGQKVQAEWLFNFIHDPKIIRPWLTLRMPTYYYHNGQVNSLVKYFNYKDDQEFPFTDIYNPHMSSEDLVAAQKLFSKDYFGCAQCHVVGDQMPTGSMESWAPNLSLAKERLKPEWIVKWITDPAAIMPGTKMPTFYDPKDPVAAAPPDVLGGDYKKQIRALRDYLLTISQHPPQVEAAPVKADAKAKVAEAPAAQSK